MREIHEQAELERFLGEARALDNVVLQALDLRPHEEALRRLDVADGVLLGCTLTPEAAADLVARGAIVFPRLEGFVFDPWRATLYTPEELFAGFDPAEPCTYCDTLDARVYRHWVETGRAHPHSIRETLARRLHDHGVTDALEALLAEQEKVVAIMGGHSMRRDEPRYLAVARMARALAERGHFLASGGGPGAMEATHLGAFFAGRPDEDLVAAVRMLAEAPLYKDEAHLAAAFRVRARWGSPAAPSLGVPTWFYGHEPPNAFASHHAKYFANSVREEGLVSLATHGIVFAPGAAGTVQEIFQDAAQNHYGTVKGLVSPMALFDVKYWTEDKPVVPLLAKLADGRPYAKRIAVSDDPEGLIAFLEANPPIEVGGGWSFCGAHCGEGCGDGEAAAREGGDAGEGS